MIECAPAPISVIIADDHTLFREGLAGMIGSEPGIEVVGVGSTGWDAIELAARHRPDIALLDIEMPGPGPRGVIEGVRDQSGLTRSVMLTMHDDEAVVRDMLGYGASAYLIKSIARENLIAALRSIATLDLVQSPSGSARQPEAKCQHRLTVRELEVLKLCALALSNSQIAVRLHITEGTVKRHMTNIFAKLGAVSRLDAVRRAHAARLLTINDETV